MDWSAFWTLVLQASIAIFIVLVLLFIGTAIYSAVRTGMRDPNSKRKQARDSIRRSNPKDN